MTTITEADVESAALDWLSALGWQVAHGPDIAPDTPHAERDHYGQVVLEPKAEGCSCPTELHSSRQCAGGRLPQADPAPRLDPGGPQPRLPPDAVMEAVAAGATGYLQKYSGKDRLLNTVRDVAQGEYRLPADVIRRVFAGIRGTAQSKADTGVRRLTAREREILTLFAQGLSYAQIAETRGNQPVTVRNAIYGI